MSTVLLPKVYKPVCSTVSYSEQTYSIVMFHELKKPLYIQFCELNRPVYSTVFSADEAFIWYCFLNLINRTPVLFPEII